MKIICFGSMNIDHVYSVDHILRPGETLEASDYNIYTGGKGLNQATALGRAKANCFMAGIRGADGDQLLADLNSSGVDTSMVKTVAGASGLTIIQVDKNGQNSILYFGGANKMIDQAYIEEVLSLCQAGDYILLQNEISMVPQIMQAAKNKGVKIAFNPSPITQELLEYPLDLVDLLILNETEGQAIAAEEDPTQVLNSLVAKFPRTDILLTLGKAGAVFKNRQEEARHGIYDVPVVDTTGAGDTFTGFFLKFYSENNPIDQCLKYASVASSLAVSRKGAAQSIPTLAEVENSELMQL